MVRTYSSLLASQAVYSKGALLEQRQLLSPERYGIIRQWFGYKAFI